MDILSRRQIILKIRLLIFYLASSFTLALLTKKMNAQSRYYKKRKTTQARELKLNVKDFMASGLSTEHRCKTFTGNLLVFSKSHDFKVGQGIKVFGVNSNTKLNKPLSPKISVSSQINNTTLYRYVIAFIDQNGSITEASLPSKAVYGNKHLSKENSILVSLNSSPEDVAAIALYRSVNYSNYALLNIFGNQKSIVDDGSLKSNVLIKGVPSAPPISAMGGYIISTVKEIISKSCVRLSDDFENIDKDVLVMHDDTKSIQRAINKINLSGGGELFIPSGTYLVGQISCGSRIRVYGSKGLTILKRQSLILDGKHWADNGILNNRLDLAFNDSGYLSGKSQEIIIESIRFDGNYYNNRASGDWASGALLNIQSCIDLVVRYNSFKNSVNAGFDLGMSEQVNCSNNYSGHHGKPFEHSAEPGIFYRCKNLNIFNNIFEDCTDGINLIGVDKANIYRNKVKNCSLGFDLWGATNSKVFNNSIKGNSVNGISVFLEGNKLDYIPSSSVEIINNVIDGAISGNNQTNAGILVIDALNWKIERNTIKNCTHGIEIYRSQAPGSQSGNHLVKNNLIRDIQGSGITIGSQNIGKITIEKNKIIKSNLIYKNSFGGLTILNGNTIAINISCNIFNHIYALNNAWIDIIKVSGRGNIGQSTKTDSELNAKRVSEIRELFSTKSC